MRICFVDEIAVCEAVNAAFAVVFVPLWLFERAVCRRHATAAVIAAFANQSRILGQMPSCRIIIEALDSSSYSRRHE